jgi:hypothetical protein
VLGHKGEKRNKICTATHEAKAEKKDAKGEKKDKLQNSFNLCSLKNGCTVTSQPFLFCARS